MPEVHEKHNLATPTPVTDGQRVYAWFGNGQVVALDMDGRSSGRAISASEYSPFQTQWGHGSSPALHGDLLILLCDHLSAAYLLALDARTGKERWKVDRGDGRVSHSTPLVVPGPKGDELLVNSSERIDVYDPATGKLLWYTGASGRRRFPPRFSTTAGFISAAGIATAITWPSVRVAAAMSRRHTSNGIRRPAPPTCRRSSTTTGCST